MTIAAYKSAGTPASVTTGTCTPTWPTHVAGDFALLIAEGNNTDFGAAPSGWTSLGRVPGNVGALEIWWKFAASGAETNPGITPTSPNHTYANIHTFTNVHATQPIHGQVNCDIITASVGRCPGLTTTVDDCLIFAVAAWNIDSAGPLASAEANSSLGSLTEREDSGTVDGNGGGLIAYTGTKAAAGLVDQTTFTLGSSAALACMTLALAPIADFTIAGTVTINGSPAANGNDVRVLDLTQPAASYLVATTTTTGGTGAFTVEAPYDDHNYQAVYEDGASYGASAVAVAV